MYKLSASNQVPGAVAAVKEGAVNGMVALDTPVGLIKADITMASIRELGIREGVQATAVFNSTDVIVEVEDCCPASLSACNRLPATVREVRVGAVSAHVVLEVDGAARLLSDVMVDDIELLGLEPGTRAYAVVSPSDVLVLRQ